MAYQTLEETRVFIVAEEFADLIWDDVMNWPDFARDTVGKQLVRAADSIGANIAEGFGRFHYGEKVTFLYYSRGSTYESKFHIRRAGKRRLYDEVTYKQRIQQLNSLALSLNAYIKDKKQKRATSARPIRPSHNKSQSKVLAPK